MQTETMMGLAIAHVVIALLATLINVGVTQTRMASNVSRDCRRFREAIRCEMTELLSLYEGNRRSLRGAKGYFLSSRACTTIYKGNVGRIITLPDAEIAPIVAAYAAAERLEHLVAATSKPHGAMAYKVVDGETETDVILDQIGAVCGKLQNALRVVGSRMDGTDGLREALSEERRLVPAPVYSEA